MEKQTITKYVLYANALLLVLGTFIQSSESAQKTLAMSFLFITWLVVAIWYMYRTTSSAEAE